MNEAIFLVLTFLSLGLVVLAATQGKAALQATAVLLAVTTSVVAGKIVPLFGLQASAGTCLYAGIFLCTDLISECYGRRAGFATVAYAFAANAVFLAVGWLVMHMTGDPAAPMTGALATLFTFLPRLLAGGLLAFVIAQSLDVWLFEYIKVRTGGKHLWLRNNASTFVSQFVDTVIIWHVAFYGVIDDIWSIILISYAVKVAVALMDTPFCYLARRLVPEVRNA